VLDELFGYLCRHDERGPDGAPGVARLPDDATGWNVVIAIGVAVKLYAVYWIHNA